MMPKGTLLIIGGAEDKVDSISLAMEKKNREFKHFEILHLLLKGKKKVDIITTPVFVTFSGTSLKPAKSG